MKKLIITSFIINTVYIQKNNKKAAAVTVEVTVTYSAVRIFVFTILLCKNLSEMLFPNQTSFDLLLTNSM